VAATRSSSISRPHRIADAIARRRSLADRSDLTAFRLVHGDADAVPGLAIDRLNNVLVLHVDSSALLETWMTPIRDVLGDYRAAFGKIHPRGGKGSSRQLWGPAVDRVEVIEHEVVYEARFDTGLNVGLFLDMRDVRGWLREAAQQRRVLNLFAYTCSFGVSAVQGGATRVLNIDLSKPYLEWGRVNYALNGLKADPHDFVYGEAFDWLGRFERRSEVFDLVILDPPSFSSSRAGTFSVERDYGRLAQAAARVTAPGGILLAATNHAGTSHAHFDATLRTAVTAAGRRYRTQQQWHEPAPDFPIPAGRAAYLKVRALILDD
jgi:23S rRNA (cytosine1962-C5)-methyltransferase